MCAHAADVPLDRFGFPLYSCYHCPSHFATADQYIDHLRTVVASPHGGVDEGLETTVMGLQMYPRLESCQVNELLHEYAKRTDQRISTYDSPYGIAVQLAALASDQRPTYEAYFCAPTPTQQTTGSSSSSSSSASSSSCIHPPATSAQTTVLASSKPNSVRSEPSNTEARSTVGGASVSQAQTASTSTASVAVPAAVDPSSVTTKLMFPEDRNQDPTHKKVRLLLREHKSWDEYLAWKFEGAEGFNKLMHAHLTRDRDKFIDGDMTHIHRIYLEGRSRPFYPIICTNANPKTLAFAYRDHTGEWVHGDTDRMYRILSDNITDMYLRYQRKCIQDQRVEVDLNVLVWSYHISEYSDKSYKKKFLTALAEMLAKECKDRSTREPTRADMYLPPAHDPTEYQANKWTY